MASRAHFKKPRPQHQQDRPKHIILYEKLNHSLSPLPPSHSSNIFWCGPLKGSPTGFVPLLVTFLIQNSSSSSVGLGDVVFNGIGSQGNITKITHKFTNSLLEHGNPHQKCHNRKISIPQSKKNISPILPERPIEHLNPHLLPYASF